MTSTHPLIPAHRRTRGLHLGRGLLMGLVRCAALIGADLVYSATIDASDDALGAGLLSFLLTATIASVWSFVDGWRRPALAGVAAWVLTAGLFALLNGLPRVLSYPTDEGGWTGVGDYLAYASDGFGFLFTLVAVPAAVGLALGQAVRLGTGPAHSSAPNRPVSR